MVLIVISDLHIGAGPLDDCDETLEASLCDFLGELCRRETPIELVACPPMPVRS